MSESLFSPSWYRVAQLRPRLRSHVRLYRHLYRGQTWYVLHDASAGRCHRLTPSAYHLAGLLDGVRTTQEVWDTASARLGDDGPTQDETIRLLGLLHFSDALRCNVSPDVAELFRRCQRRQSAEWWKRYANPLAFRMPLLDPDAFLQRWTPLVRPLFTRAAFVLWCVVVGIALLLAGSHWSELTADASEQLLDPVNLALLWLVYPAVKTFHELGHGFAARVWGAEVHEVGIMFLVLFPLPYVDASATAVFPDKWRRMSVGAAGVMVELLLASLALFIWLLVEPGVVRSVAYNVMVIGGVSSLLFNGNPLLRFDGYYVLADLIEIPNLSQRSTQYLSYLALHHVFGLEQARCPVNARGEVGWFVTYGIAAFIYRLFIMCAIALFVATRFFVFGVCLAIFAVTMQVVVPLVKGGTFLLSSPRLGQQRPRALAISSALAAGLALLLGVVPVPLFTMAEGVVWPPEGAQVRTGAEGFVVGLLARPNAKVREGEPLLRTRDPEVEAKLAVLEGRLAELRARLHGERSVADRVRTKITEEEIAAVEAERALARERAGEVVVRSPGDGSFLVPRASDLPGHFLGQGELIGYVVAPPISTVRVVVSQADVALVRGRTEGVDVRLSREPGRVLEASIRREVPAASDRLPSPALGTAGGGRLVVDPSDAEGTRTLESVFQLELALPDEAAVREIGGRVWVRFDHGSEPLALRLYRGVRRLFLERIGV